MNSLAHSTLLPMASGARSLRRQAGLTLVELMIAITLGLILVAGMTTLISQQSGARAELERSTRQIENGRYAIQLLQDDIQQAGYYGDFFPPVPGLDKVLAAPWPLGVLEDLCATAPSSMGWGASPLQIPTALYGLNDDAASFPSCVTNRRANTDIIVIRRMETQPVTTPVAGEAYLQVSACATEIGTTPFVFGTPPATTFTLRKKDCDTANPANIWKYLVRIYYVSDCNVCGTDTIPTLKYVELRNGTMETVPLVEGIENLQINYGIDTAESSSPDTYTDSPDADQWANVLSVQLHLLARSNEATPGYVNDKQFNLGGAAPVGPFNDGFKRQVFTRAVRAINPSGRSEL